MAAPVVTIGNHTLNLKEWAQVKNWPACSDADGNPAVTYQFKDCGTDASSSYFWTLNDTDHAADTMLEVTASDLANVWIRGRTTDGSETLWVRTFDGTDWSHWDTSTLTTHDPPPVATITGHTLNFNQWAQAKNWLSYSDADSNAASRQSFRRRQ